MDSCWNREALNFVVYAFDSSCLISTFCHLACDTAAAYTILFTSVVDHAKYNHALDRVDAAEAVSWQGLCCVVKVVLGGKGCAGW